MATRKIEVVISGDSSKLESAFGKAGSSASKTEGALSKLGTIAKVGAAAGFVALAGAAKIGWDEMMQGQKVSAQTSAALKSTGGAANVTKKHIEGLSNSLMKQSGADDDLIQSGANLLLTFTNIRNGVGKSNQIFDQANQAALDLSTAFGKDLPSSAILVGKALNDPIKGVSALTKVGVTFTQGQKDAIKAMVDSGNTMGAQKIILAELSKEVGGSAAAYGKTLPGQIDIAKQTLSNFAGNVVGMVVPALASVVNWIGSHWGTISGVFSTVWDAARTATSTAIGWIDNNVVPVVTGVINGVKAVWDRLAPIVSAAFTAVYNIIGPALDTIKSAIAIPLAILSGDWGKVWDSLKGLVKGALDLVVGVITGIGGTLWAAAKGLAQGAIDAIAAIFGGLAGQVSGWFLGGVRAILDLVDNFGGAAWRVGSGAISALTSVFSGVGSAVSGWFLGGVRAILDLVDNAAGAAGRMATAAFNAFMAPIRALYGAVSSVLDAVAGLFRHSQVDAQTAINNLNAITASARGPTGTFSIVPGTSITAPRTAAPVSYNAEGGIYSRPTLTWVGEAGTEAIVPLTRPTRRDQVMQQAGLAGGGRPIQLVINNYGNQLDENALMARASWLLRTATA